MPETDTSELNEQIRKPSDFVTQTRPAKNYHAEKSTNGLLVKQLEAHGPVNRIYNICSSNDPKMPSIKLHKQIKNVLKHN